MPIDPIGLISNIGGSLTASITLAKLVSDVKNTPGDVKTCLLLVESVNSALQHLISLRTKHHNYLSNKPEDLIRIDQTIIRSRDSLLSVGSLLERCRVEANGGVVPLKSKMRWVLGDSAAFVLRTKSLAEQHADLNKEIMILKQQEFLQPVLTAVEDTTFENLDLLCLRRKTSAASMSSRISRGKDAPPPYTGDLTPPALTSPGSTQYQDNSPIISEMSAQNTVWEEPIFKDAELVTYVEVQQQTLSISIRDDEEDETEVAWFRDLRLQAEERQRRRSDRAGYRYS